MILQALRQLAISEGLVGDPDFEYKPVAWRVNLGTDGRLIGIEDLRRNVNEGTKKKPKWVGLEIEVPMQFYRSGTAPPPYFLVDNAKFVFGKPAGNAEFDPQQGRDFSERFRRLVASCAEQTADAGVLAVMQFFERYPPGTEEIQLPAEAAGNDLIAFRVGLGELAHLRPAVRDWWKRQRQGQLGEGDAYQCLVTGRRFGRIEQFPQVANVPGAPKPVKLISFNQSAFESFGLERNENAAVSREAGEQAAAALNRLLHPQPRDGRGNALSTRHVRLPGDTAVCFWCTTKNAEAESFLDSLNAIVEGEDETTVAESYRSIWHGRPVELKEPAAFYTLVLSGTQGRIIVRDWFETSLQKAVECLTKHFIDLKIVRHARPAKDKQPSPSVPLRWLMEALASEGRQDPVPGSLEAAIFRAALTGAAYPLQILQRALLRARVETGRDKWTDLARRDARAALLKAVLNRRRRLDPQTAARYEEVKPDMNPNYDNPGYALGALMAVLERLQSAALGQVNTTLVDRYFSAASSTPRMIFVRLLRNAQHHARKARDSDDKRDRDVAFLCGRVIDWIADRFDVDRKCYPPRINGLPPHLDLEEQGLFVLGYHQMRYWLWMSKEERTAWEQRYPDAPAALRWLKRPAEEQAQPEAAIS